jgi:predicted AlkP superfamily phosphohydrolase/phosphomutase
MELLVIGIDGGTKEIIDNMPMPFTQSLFKQAKYKTLSEDLISRGWAEILTGCHAADTKAFYLMPFADKSYDFSGSYSKNDMVHASPSKPLWELLNEKGASVGIVNVPTTGPVDKVNGFFIAGGGGGIKAKGGLPPGMFYPDKCRETLKRNDYVFDIRLPGEAKTISEFIQKISTAEKGQKNAFVELSLSEKPDFGFHCFRITTEIQYLCRYEIDRCIKGLKNSIDIKQDFKPESTVQESIISHYVKLDQYIEDIFTKLQPENFLFIGDHSTSLFTHEGNLDVWLESAGYLQVTGKYRLLMDKVRRFVNKKLAFLLHKNEKIKQPKKGLIRKPITKFHASKTKAFGTFYDTGNFAGIFVNDSERFSGAVKTEQEINTLVDKICDSFNSDKQNQDYKLNAQPYKRNFKGAKFSHLMPDIKINKPDTIYFSSRRWEYITKNPYMAPIDEPILGKKYPYTGAKGSDPLFVYSEALDKYIESTDPNDLRLAYRMIDRFFSKGLK